MLFLIRVGIHVRIKGHLEDLPRLCAAVTDVLFSITSLLELVVKLKSSLLRAFCTKLADCVVSLSRFSSKIPFSFTLRLGNPFESSFVQNASIIG